MLRRYLSRFPIAAMLLAGHLGGCVGKVGDPSTGSTSPPPGGNTPVGNTPGSNTPVGNTPGVASVSYAMVRLTNTQYLNTAHDLLATVSFPDPPLPNENVSSGFSDVGTTQAVTALVMSDYQEAAAAIAGAVHDQIRKVLSCQPASTADEESCARGFIADFGKRAYRRPIREDESARLLALFKAQRAGGADFPSAISDLVEAVLQSPAFLYRLESGQQDPTNTAVSLTPYELASRLSYFLTNSMPDSALLAAANAGALQSADQIEAQARRLLGTARAHDAVARFHYEWLNLVKMDSLAKDAKTFPGFSAALASDSQRGHEALPRVCLLAAKLAVGDAARALRLRHRRDARRPTGSPRPGRRRPSWWPCPIRNVPACSRSPGCWRRWPDPSTIRRCIEACSSSRASCACRRRHLPPASTPPRLPSIPASPRPRASASRRRTRRPPARAATPSSTMSASASKTTMAWANGERRSRGCPWIPAAR